MSIVHSNPVVLKWAREQSGFNLEEVAKKLKRKTVTAQTITEWESGRAFPSYSQLEDLAYKIYKRPLALFFFPEPPDESDIKNSFRTLPKRIEKLSPRMRFLIRKARVMQHNLMELYEDNLSEETIFKDIKFTASSSIKNLSKKVRNYLKIDLEEQKKWRSPEKALRQWREAVESSGVFIFKDSFKESDFSGFCLYDSCFPIIYVNSKQTPARQIFTIFHELAHILFRTSGLDPIDEQYFRSLRDSNKKIEQMCNEFAGAFLIPEESLFLKNYDMDNNTEVSVIYSYAKEYSVSPEVFLRRIFKKKIINRFVYNNLIQKVQKEYKEFSQERKPRPVSPFTVKESHLGKKYISLVYSKYYKNQISLKQLADYFDVKPDFALSMEPESRFIKKKKHKNKTVK